MSHINIEYLIFKVLCELMNLGFLFSVLWPYSSFKMEGWYRIVTIF